MRLQLLMAILALCAACGCSRRIPQNSRCEWPQEPARTLNTDRLADRWHLREDVESAEDLAIRRADAVKGVHSGHFAGMPEYIQARSMCLESLAAAIAGRHGVTREQIRHAIHERRYDIDFGVIFSFVMLYGTGLYFLSRWLCRRFPEDGEWLTAALLTVVAAGAAGFLGVSLGEVWSTAIESIRLSSGHLSYRVDRLPWIHYRVVEFTGVTVLFCLFTALHYRRGIRATATARQSLLQELT